MTSRERHTVRWLVIGLAAAWCASPVTSAQGASKAPALLAKGSAPDHSWNWELQHWPGSDVCASSGRYECGAEVFLIANNSSETIECLSSITYRGRAGGKNEYLTRIRAQDKWSQQVTLEAYGSPVKSHSVSCHPYRPEPVMKLPEGCTRTMRGADLADFYPKESQNLEETGVARVRVTLAKADGRASNVRLTDSSLYRRLDDAALAFVKKLTFTTNCPGSTFDLAIRFSLAD